jgi:hypothetical protein
VAEGVLVLLMTPDEKGLEKTLDVAHFLDTLRHVVETLFNQRLDVFTDSSVSSVQCQECADIVQGETSRLSGTDKADALKGVIRIDTIIIVGSFGWLNQLDAFIIPDCRGGNASGTS